MWTAIDAYLSGVKHLHPQESIAEAALLPKLNQSAASTEHGHTDKML